jgi:hypothetical protein
MYALCAFYQEVKDIADGEATPSLKRALLAEWRSEIALLYAGRPRHLVTRAVHEAVHQYGLRCDDFLAVIDGMEMDSRRDIRAPSLAELDLYCARVAVAIGLLSVASLASRRRRASRRPSGGPSNSPTSCVISPRMGRAIASICRASYCWRSTSSPRCRATCWLSPHGLTGR